MKGELFPGLFILKVLRRVTFRDAHQRQHAVFMSVLFMNYDDVLEESL